MFCPAVTYSAALQIFRSLSYLYFRCENFICLSTSCLIVTMRFSRRTWNGCGDVVPVASVGKFVGLTKAVDPRGRCGNMRLDGNRFVDLRAWTLYSYFNGCTYMSKPLWCSATKCRRRAIIILWKISVFLIICGSYVVVVRGYVPKKAQSDSKNLLINVVSFSIKTYSGISYVIT